MGPPIDGISGIIPDPVDFDFGTGAAGYRMGYHSFLF